MKTTFYIVRHGRTVFNKKGLVQGWCDSPLIQEGIDQAKILGQNLKDIDFAYGISSSSERASDTMNLILQNRCPSSTSKGLKETGFGLMEGDSIDTSFPNGFIDPKGYPEKGGEPMDKALVRFIDTLEKVAKDYQGKNILVVSHGNILCGFLRTLDQEFQKSTLYPGKLVPNCSVTIVTYDNGEFTLESWPDTSYLQQQEL